MSGGILGVVAAPKDDVVVAVRVEGRVEVDQVDGGIGQGATQDVEVVAVGEDVGGECRHRFIDSSRRGLQLGRAIGRVPAAEIH